MLMAPGFTVRVVWLCVGISAAVGAAGEIDAQGTLSGLVIGPEGAPVAGARISVGHRGLHQDLHGATDASGRFRIGPVEPVSRGLGSIRIEAEGYAFQDIPGEWLSIFPGSDTDVGTIRMAAGRVFMGRVLDSHGSPAAGAAVEAHLSRHYLGHTISRIGTPMRTTTGADGWYRLPPAGVGILSIQASLPGRRKAFISQHPVAPGGVEVLEPIRLEPDVPVPGVVTDDKNQGLAGVRISAGGIAEVVSDKDGRFTFRGFGPHPRFQMIASKQGYVRVNRGVHLEDDGVRWTDVYETNPKEYGPFPDLKVVMSPLAWIEGTAVDDETGVPVKLDRVVLCFFERKPNGEVVLRGCRIPEFEQPSPGRFRVAYADPDEYHVTASAQGFHDGEAFTPKIAVRQTVSGVIVRMRKKTPGTSPTIAHQTLTGRVTRDGKAVASGWVSLWMLRRKHNTINADVMRGRTTEGDPVIYASAPVRDGSYTLSVPFQHERWYIVVEEAYQALTQVGPFPIELNESRTLDITCTEGGRIRGVIRGLPELWRGQAWVVAFGKTGVRAEVQAGPDGSFALPPLPPGEYGLKAGHDAYTDSEIPQGDLASIPKSAWERDADPWKNAQCVQIEPGRDVDKVELEFPR